MREIQEKLQQEKGIDVSISGINRTLTRLGLGRKKKTLAGLTQNKKIE